jgi:hypothetical protein
MPYGGACPCPVVGENTQQWRKKYANVMNVEMTDAE